MRTKKIGRRELIGAIGATGGWLATLHDYPALSRSDVKTTIAMFGRFLRVWTELTRGAVRLKLRERSLSDQPAAAVGTRG